MVFRNLKPTEAANFRLLCRNVAEVGIQYIVPTIYVRLKKESYDRLSTIAEHPVISQFVHAICYETDVLTEMDRDRFESLMKLPGQPKPIRSDDSSRARRVINREATKNTLLSTNGFGPRNMDGAFSVYEKYIADQQAVLKLKALPAQVTTAMKRLPGVTVLRTNSESTIAHFSEDMRAISGAPGPFFLSDVDDEPDEPDQPCAAHLACLSSLLGAGNASLKLEVLSCAPFDWRILGQTDEDFLITKKSLRYLRELEIEVRPPEVDQETMEPYDSGEEDEFEVHVENKRLVDFVTSAAELRLLSIDFLGDSIEVYLGQAVGDFHWAALETVRLGRMATTEDEIVAFCGRHSATLKSLSLRDIELNEGDWPSTLRKLRSSLKLKCVEIKGWLNSYSAEVYWDMRDYRLGSSRALATRKRIEHYLQDHAGGDMSYYDYVTERAG